ncbi:MAG: ABC transporter permease [Chloroflexi bacterium]|nr:ABC transporter permease [Chloroflexota bacterium]
MHSLVDHEEGLVYRILKSILAAVFGLLVGGVFVLFTQSTPLEAYSALLRNGFGCEQANNCAWWTTLQWATPLIFSGLSAAVAFRAGIFSIGQIGQMSLGAAFAAMVATHIQLPGLLHPAFALAVAALAGGIWGLIPGLLKVCIGVNEILSTLVMNTIAAFLIAAIPTGRYIPETARLDTLAAGSKLNTGFFLALAALVFVFLYLFYSRRGYEVRMSGQAPLFARNGGLHPVRAVASAMLLSGALAGLGGAVEVLGVHYHFVTNFSAVDSFDGLIVALLGQTHPLGIFFAAVFLGGVRLGSLGGLMIDAGVPRELGGAMIAIMVIFMCAEKLYHPLLKRLTSHRNVK